MKYTKILMLIGAMFLLHACTSDDLSSESIFKPTEMVQTDFDKWLDANYNVPYNIEFNYKYNDKLSDNYYNVVPADIEKAKSIAILVKHVWLGAYAEVAGEQFVKDNSFRVMQLIGSAQYDGQGKIVLGTAEGGLKILLFRINELNPDEVYVNQDDFYADKRSKPLDLNHWYFHTMHHEFSHILHQKKNYSPDFRTISTGKYHSTDWINVKDPDAATEGFVSGYGSSEPDEDFAELYSTYLTSSDKAWAEILQNGVKIKTDASGDTLFLRDKNGDYVYETDAQGNKVPLLDANGGLVPAKDKDGNIIYQKDAEGNPVYITVGGERVIRYQIHDLLSVSYLYEDGQPFPCLISEGKIYPVNVPVGNMIYQKDSDGNVIFDAKGNPVPEYLKMPVFEFKRVPEADTFGRDAILQKLEIMRSYLKDSWGIDIDHLREVILRRSKEAETLDLKTLK